MGPCLKTTEAIEDPEGFKDVLEAAYKPSKGRKAHFEIIHGTWDWNEYFSHLNINISGLVTNKDEPVVNHAWRVIRRGDMVNYADGSDHWTVEVTCEDRWL